MKCCIGVTLPLITDLFRMVRFFTLFFLKEARKEKHGRYIASFLWERLGFIMVVGRRGGMVIWDDFDLNKPFGKCCWDLMD